MRLAGPQLLGWNERAFQVHPEVFAQDEHFRAISTETGVAFQNLSPEKITTMQQNFVRACGGGGGPKIKKLKPSTHNETLIHWNEGKNLIEIAKARGLTGTTILSHVEKLVGQGQIPRVDLARLLDAKLAAALADLHATFRELSTDRLAPVYDHFHGAYSYDELRVVRMMMEQ